MTRARRALVILTLVGIVATISAQSRPSGWGSTDASYDGRFTFVRLRWERGTFGAPVAGRGHNMWLHEFPRAEQNLMTTLGDFTLVDAVTDASLILTLDDPELFKHPIITMWEPGFWTLTDEEAARLRAYLLKGGFLIFNDFEGPQWANFEAQMRRVLPDSRWLPLDETHPIFETFVPLDDIHAPNPLHHHLRGLRPEYFGLFEDNDPTGRLMAIANYNTNLGEYWQGAGGGYYSPEALSRAFGLGINYVIYGLTH